MDALVLSSVISLSGIGVVAAGVLFIIAKRFHVDEDPRIDLVEEVLPGANCGGCGLPGCRNFAEAIVKAQDLTVYTCPAGGSEALEAMAKVLKLEAGEVVPKAALLRCNGSCENAPPKATYNGIASCLIAHNTFAGPSGCSFGCLGLGDCVDVCTFDAIYVDEKTGLPIIDEDKCTGCGACIKVCPRKLFELWPKAKDGRVYVACINTQKGAAAKKNCATACIGCKKCVKVVGGDETHKDKVKVENFLCYIDADIDVKKYGHALVESCPTHAILGVNLPEQDADKGSSEDS